MSEITQAQDASIPHVGMTVKRHVVTNTRGDTRVEVLGKITAVKEAPFSNGTPMYLCDMDRKKGLRTLTIRKNDSRFTLVED